MSNDGAPRSLGGVRETSLKQIVMSGGYRDARRTDWTAGRARA
jgi:hypothetical protein